MLEVWAYIPAYGRRVRAGDDAEVSAVRVVDDNQN